jgi:hypothetical protein
MKSTQPTTKSLAKKASTLHSQLPAASIHSADEMSEGQASVRSKRSNASIKRVEKEVVFVSPILLGNDLLPETISPEKVKYTAGEPIE